MLGPPFKENFYNYITAALYKTIVLYVFKKLTFLKVTKITLVSLKSFEVPRSVLNNPDPLIYDPSSTINLHEQVLMLHRYCCCCNSKEYLMSCNLF